MGLHIAHLNLFLEKDGALYVTIAGGNVSLIQELGAELNLLEALPADTVLRLVAAAKNIEAIAR